MIRVEEVLAKAIFDPNCKSFLPGIGRILLNKIENGLPHHVSVLVLVGKD